MTIAKEKWTARIVQSGHIMYSGRFLGPGGTGNLAAVSGGRGFVGGQIVYGGSTGVYNVVFDEVAINLLGWNFDVLNSTMGVANHKTVNVLSYTPSTKTMVIEVANSTGSALVNLAAGDQLVARIDWADTDRP